MSFPSTVVVSENDTEACLTLEDNMDGLDRDVIISAIIGNGTTNDSDLVTDDIERITIPPNSIAGDTFCFAIAVDDDIVEETETFSIDLYVGNPLDTINGDNVTVASGTIIDNDGKTCIIIITTECYI